MSHPQHASEHKRSTNDPQGVQTVSTTSQETCAMAARVSVLSTGKVLGTEGNSYSPTSVRDHITSLDPRNPPKQLVARGLTAACTIQCQPLEPGRIERATLAYQVTNADALRSAFGSRVSNSCLVLPTFNAAGECAAWRLWTPQKINGVDRFAPAKSTGWATKDAVYADPEGQRLLRGQSEPNCILVVEGEPDFLTACLLAHAWRNRGLRVAVLGLHSGAWGAEFAARIPKQAQIILATHRDTAGEGYAQAVRLDLPREQHVDRLLSWKPGFEGDANDYWGIGFGGWRAAIEGTAIEEELTPNPETKHMPAPPTAESDRWTWTDAQGWTEKKHWAPPPSAPPDSNTARALASDDERGWMIAKAFNWWWAKYNHTLQTIYASGATHGKGGWGGQVLLVLRAAKALSMLARDLDEAQRDHCNEARLELSGALEAFKHAAESSARDKETRRDRLQLIKDAAQKAARDPLSDRDVLRPITHIKTPKRSLKRSKTQTKTTIQTQTTPTANEEKSLFISFVDGIAQVCQRYLPRDLLTEKLGETWRTITLQSAQGTGKTEVFKDLVTQSREKGQRVLILTHRQSLAWQLAKRTGAVCYLDGKKAYVLEEGQALVVCIDSLPKKLLMRDGHLPDLVLIDESEQVAHHLFSRTIGNKIFEVARDLQMVLSRGARVVCADADAGVLTEALLAWAGREKGLWIVNRWAGWGFNVSKTNTVHVLEDGTNVGRLQLWAQIREEVRQATKKPDHPPIMVASTSCAEAHCLASFLALEMGYPTAAAAREDHKILCVTGDSKDGPHEQRFLDNPNEELRKWPVVIYTPALGTGFSLDYVVSRVFVIGKGVEGITGPSMVQLMTRARNQRKPLTIWLDNRVFENLPSTVAEARHLASVLLDAHADSISRVGNTSAFVRKQFRARLADRACLNEFDARLHELWLQVIAETGRTGRDPRASTLETLKTRGARVVFVRGHKPLATSTILAMKEKLKEEDILGIFGALPLSEDEDLERLRQIATKEARYKVAHHDIETRLGRPITPQDAKAEVERGMLVAGRKLATASVVLEGGDEAKFLAQQAEAKVLKSLATPDRHKSLPQTVKTVDILVLAGLEDLLKSGALEHELSIDAPQRLALVRAYGEQHREMLTALGLAPPKKDCQDHRKDAETLRWLTRILRRLGFQVETRRASGAAQRKGAKARTYWVTSDAALEAWCWAEVPLAQIKDAALRDNLSWGLPA